MLVVMLVLMSMLMSHTSRYLQAFKVARYKNVRFPRTYHLFKMSWYFELFFHNIVVPGNFLLRTRGRNFMSS